MKDRGNWDFDHGHEFDLNPRIKRYGALDLKHYTSTTWSGDRKQHRSRLFRNNALRSDKKHTRQFLKQEMVEELNDF